jgi:hypothetical protein
LFCLCSRSATRLSDARLSFCVVNFFLPGFIHNYVYFLSVAATVRCDRRAIRTHRPYEQASPARGIARGFFATRRFEGCGGRLEEIALARIAAEHERRGPSSFYDRLKKIIINLRIV